MDEDDRQFDVAEPDKVWVSDITYIKTYEGFLYLAVVIDLYSRLVIGWATQSRQPTDLVLQALLMAVWRRSSVQRPKVRDRCAETADVSKICFTSSILPKWARRTSSLDALLPVLYLRGNCGQNQGRTVAKDRKTDGVYTHSGGFKKWLCLKGRNQLPKLIEGIKFNEGVKVTDANETCVA